MSISFRVVMVLVCAYAGWDTASLQFGDLPDSQQLTKISSRPQ
jgi:hypothetical protein